MKNNDINKFCKTKENVIFITLLALTLLGMYIDIHIIYIEFFIILNILIFLNIRRINAKKPNIIKFTIRRSLYVIPFTIPIILGDSINIEESPNTILYVIGMSVIVFIFMYSKKDVWNIMFDDEIISMSNKRTRYDYFTNCILLISAPITEELFFRNFIITQVRESLGIFAIILGAYLFWFQHYQLSWSDSFSKNDFYIQFIFGLISGSIFYFTNNIIPSIVGHLLFNFINVLLECKKYHFYYIKNGETHGRCN